MELAIDTSTVVAGVAIAHEGRPLAEIAWRAGYKHTKQLYATIEFALQQAGASLDKIQAVAVAIGPGSFSGLRVGVSAAKGFAESLGIPLVGVPTMAVEAFPFAGLGLPIRPILDAGRGEIAVACYRDAQGRLEEIDATRITTIEALVASITERTLFCGEHLPAVQTSLATLGPLAMIPPSATLPRRPGSLAALAWQRLERGERDDAATLQPLYLRGPSITKPGPARTAKKGS
ncbi:MAG: tRNA (adenosine(37)-N6)-threonylcarbamoyltransferase complex dimerization subunit type 1 TsaB [Chloroflexi bacterium]|nr:tRNA (adenosine(37)-N6)-threonylcarbamoyltransferase complex dimerization subunit type 1 TsaB [Chloroflexota bacterium]